MEGGQLCSFLVLSLAFVIRDSTQGFNLISESDIGEPGMSSHSSVPSNATQRTKLKARSYLIGNRKGSSLAGKQNIGDIEL